MGNPTKELCHKLDELGVEYDTSEDDTTIFYDIDGNRYTYNVNPESGWAQLYGYNLTPEQAIAATVGRGNLTAEQVREAIMSADRWRKPMGDTGMTNTHLIIRDDGWQAIADELNATGGRRDTMGLWPEWEQVLFANVSDEVAQDNLNECVHDLLDKAATVGAGTCHVKAAKKLGDLFGFSLSCGHSMVNQFDDRPDYCPWCGAKVMDE